MNTNSDNKRFKAIDFFCGGGGMTCGLRQAGIDVIAGVDIDHEAKETYEFNNQGTVFIDKDIRTKEQKDSVNIFQFNSSDNIKLGKMVKHGYSLIKKS